MTPTGEAEHLERLARARWQQLMTRWTRRPPLPQFQPFECVSCRDPAAHHPEMLLGLPGVVIWADYSPRPHIGGWVYVVEVDEVPPGVPRRFWTLREERLVSRGTFSSAVRHLGQRHEVSFDVLNGQEGCVRHKGSFWECYFFSHQSAGSAIKVSSGVQECGLMGHLITLPEHVEIEPDLVKATLREKLGMESLHEVGGPDSMSLR